MRAILSLTLCCAFSLAILGCRDRKSERRLVDVAVKLDNNSARIEKLSLALDGLNARLANIERSLGEIRQASAPRGEGSPASAAAVDRTDLESISRQVAALAEELAVAKEEIASAQGGLEKIRVKISDSINIDVSLAKLAGRPDEFVAGLDKLLEIAQPRIEDPVARQNFEAEMAQLRNRVLSGYTPEELYRELRSLYVEKLNLVTGEKDRQSLEREIERLDNCSEEELRKRLDQFHRERTSWDFLRIAKAYGLQKEDVIAAWFAAPEKK